MILLLALAAFLGMAGELGVRIEGLAPASIVWLEADWEDAGVTARVEGNVLPLGFRRASLKIDYGIGSFSLTPEFTVFSTGRIDLFLSAYTKATLAVPGTSLTMYAGAKGGLAAVNLAPTQIFATWLVLALEKDGLSGELGLDGPYPWQPSLKVAWNQVTLSLGNVISLTLSGECSGWQGSSTFQVWPKPLQTHTLIWSKENTEFRASLATSGQSWCRVSESTGEWEVSAFFTFSQVHLTQVILEVVRTF